MEKSQNAAADHLTKIISNERVADGVYHLTISAPALAKSALPGQFAQVKIEGAGLLLRRPLGIAGADAAKGTVEIFYRVVGKGTDRLTQYRAGEEIFILGALGHGFHTEKSPAAKRALLVGGGMGLAPLLFLAQRLDGAEALLGGRNAAELFWTKFYEPYAAALHITTDDGSLGEKGFAVSLLPALLQTKKYDRVAVCGPEIMMKKAAEICAARNIPCEVSLERRMACGLGACLSCNIDAADGRRLHVCQDGPVFDSKEVFG